MSKPGLNEIVARIRSMMRGGECIVVAGVGSGITAKAAALGGADMVAVYNTAVYRIAGLPTGMAFLPYDDCNELSFSALPEVLAGAGDTPVVLGLGAHDPRKPVDLLIRRALEMCADGVTNEPFIGMYEGDIRAQMEAAGLGFSKEVELLSKARRSGMLTLGYAFSPEEAARLAGEGVHIIGAMLGGITSGGAAGGADGGITPDGAARLADLIVEAVQKVNPDVPVLTHGGPLNDLNSVKAILARTGASGYITGSTGERIPVENAVKEAVRGYKSLSLRGSARA